MLCDLSTMAGAVSLQRDFKVYLRFGSDATLCNLLSILTCCRVMVNIRYIVRI